MRIVVLGAKGGVGKSMVALLLVRFLLSLGKRILVVDRDMTGYISWLAGIRGKGLMASVIDNEEHNYLKTFNVDKGILHVLKFYGDGPRLVNDVRQFSREDIANEVKERYREVLSLPHDHIIYDNRGMIEPSEIEFSLEIGMYLTKYPHTQSYWVYVSDSLDVNLKMTLDYDDYLWSKWSKNLNVKGRSLVINMVPPDYKLPNLDLSRFNVVIQIPFMEGLFEYSGRIEELPVVSSLSPILPFLG
ncbi:Iron-sulfur cluster carrier protein [Metallosphaera sp. J1]|uniref:nucleotide-binding protein n=1 Tax=Metallosphaera javensis (ex Hofmann et al. 2022) TaxID=99938 RepID=UPI001EDD1A65|nr:P-loop NTPase [Metallosphaera javensis (ex Hofmann et al. 2022)]MCG3109676.1 Iron-sulfur cluster carrier protein [Metallosphaera javensis (ex Hofmann et al. 2022)]